MTDNDLLKFSDLLLVGNCKSKNDFSASLSKRLQHVVAQACGRQSREKTFFDLDGLTEIVSFSEEVIKGFLISSFVYKGVSDEGGGGGN